MYADRNFKKENALDTAMFSNIGWVDLFYYHLQNTLFESRFIQLT